MTSSQTITVNRAQLMCLLADFDVLRNTTGEKIARIKPTHGNCCTCQRCGHGHDECCCNHNDFLDMLKAMIHEAAQEYDPDMLLPKGHWSRDEHIELFTKLARLNDGGVFGGKGRRKRLSAILKLMVEITGIECEVRT